MAAPENTSINFVRGGFGCTAPGTAELPKLPIDLMGYSGGYVGSRGIAASGGHNAMETVGGSFVRPGGHQVCRFFCGWRLRLTMVWR